jgi:hypothetical protein
MKFNKKLIWYSLPILVGGFLIYKQFSRGSGKKDVPQPPQTGGGGSGTGTGGTGTGGESSAYPLRNGSKNSTVGSLQSLLNTALSCSGKTLLVVDNSFGSKTETALSSLTGKTSISNSAEFEAVKKQLASTCSKSSNLDWAWQLIAAQNTSKYSVLVVSQPIQISKVIKDFKGLWIPATPRKDLMLNPRNYSLKDYVLRSATTNGALRIEITKGDLAGMYLTKDGANLKSFNIS